MTPVTEDVRSPLSLSDNLEGGPRIKRPGRRVDNDCATSGVWTTPVGHRLRRLQNGRLVRRLPKASRLEIVGIRELKAHLMRRLNPLSCSHGHSFRAHLG